jgi:hypothetical protein
MRRIRNVMICLVLAGASLHNVRMRSDEIEALMEAMREPKVAHVLQEEQDNGDDLGERLPAVRDNRVEKVSTRHVENVRHVDSEGRGIGLKATGRSLEGFRGQMEDILKRLMHW